MVSNTSPVHEYRKVLSDSYRNLDSSSMKNIKNTIPEDQDSKEKEENDEPISPYDFDDWSGAF